MLFECSIKLNKIVFDIHPINLRCFCKANKHFESLIKYRSTSLQVTAFETKFLIIRFKNLFK